MQEINWKQLTKQRLMGLVLIVLGVFVVFAPLFFGAWIVSLLGIAFVVAGVFQFIETFRSGDATKTYLSYAGGVISILIGIVLFLSPATVLSGVLIAITVFFLIDGGIKLYGAYNQTGSDRWWSLFNGIVMIGLAVLVWFFVSANLGIVAIGVVLGGKLIVEGWTMFFMPEKKFQAADEVLDTREHPDRKLRLEPSDTVKQIQDELLRSEEIITSESIYWCLTLLAILFFIHFFRTDASWSFIDLISPVTAVIGDAAVALALGIILILPLRLIWRWLTRPVERAAWNHFARLHEKAEDPTVPEQVLKFWIASRMRFALELRKFRESINFTFWRLLRFGIPLTAVLVAVNSIWGFSWYFNSENWASGVFQALTKTKVDPWRKRMAEMAEGAALAKGVPPEKVFAIEPEGTTDSGDYSFVVIGDTGEGDASQMVLRDQIIAAGKREDVKFLVLSSDVIYPDGRMKDYERNFYLQFKGFEKPLYAIPGNHDWFDANEGFNANFLDPVSADLALRARLIEDLKTDAITTEGRFAEIIAESARLRNYYGIKNGLQRAPFFEMQSPGFSLFAIDTGIMKSLDEKQKVWFESALTRAGTNFKMVILGHPFLVAGEDTSGDAASFTEIYEMLKKHKVSIAMAGDTHDFEFYKTKYTVDTGEKEMFHFVNGGGGAYLSVGTSLAFPEHPASPNYVFYPRENEATTKIRTESPYWKMPFLVWMQVLGGWPFSKEMVSGAFDFNKAPFFQSFLEVKVERSQNRVRLLLYGANGQLRWRDIQVGGDVKPADKSDDDFVEFIAPLAQ